MYKPTLYKNKKKNKNKNISLPSMERLKLL